MQPTLGQTVLTRVDPASNNGADVAPAVITRVWGPHGAGGWTVNVKILTDENSVLWLTSIRLVDAEPDPETSHVAWWPPAKEAPTAPALGDVVLYRGKQGRLAMRAAIVTATVSSLDPDGVACGDVPALDDDQHVHLWVFTPGQSGGFPEFNVPHGHGDEAGDDIPPGSWHWPPRV